MSLPVLLTTLYVLAITAKCDFGLINTVDSHLGFRNSWEAAGMFSFFLSLFIGQLLFIALVYRTSTALVQAVHCVVPGSDIDSTVNLRNCP